MYLDTSSMVNLTCVISYTLSSPNTVTWYHNHTKLTIRGPRTGVSIMVDKSEVTTISLILQTASVADSGLYECHPDNAPNASLVIHVLEGEHRNPLLSIIPDVQLQESRPHSSAVAMCSQEKGRELSFKLPS